MIVIISVLLFIGKCNRTKKVNSNENKEEEVDTIAVVDTTVVSSSTKNNEPIITPNTNLDYSEAAIKAAADKTAIGKSLKGTSLENEGDIATQEVNTDQINKVGGEGPQSFNSAFIESARTIPSKK